MMKRSSFSYKKRQSLSDITNYQSQEELNNLQKPGLDQSEQVNRLMKENVALVKLLEEREYELRNLREGVHKLQAQNWSLAQTNSQFLAEINLARNKVKALHHEVTCKNALLKGQCCEQENGENTRPRSVLRTESVVKIADEEFEKPSLPNRRRFIRSKSIGASTGHNTEAEKQKSETKRRQLRRRSSARVRSAAQEVTENLFEIEDLQLTMPYDICQQDKSTMASRMPKKEEEEEDSRRRDVLTRHQDCKSHRSPVDRSSHRADERMHSYKEVSFNTIR